ncbi:hypothetical protein F5B20DRAFT_583147 [Whalleya microplaca]|nr:hypothetical protein F5B20DRAFT_583147 [Whalleya microplaca]
MGSQAHLPAPRRIVASNLALPDNGASRAHSEPGVEVVVDTLQPEPILGGSLVRARVATVKSVPTSNDGSGRIELDDVPGVGVVMPGGANIYYLDVAPNTEGTMHRTTSQDYLVVLQGTLSLLTPSDPFEVVDGRGTYGELTETLCQPGEVVIQRGMIHA